NVTTALDAPLTTGLESGLFAVKPMAEGVTEAADKLTASGFSFTAAGESCPGVTPAETACPDACDAGAKRIPESSSTESISLDCLCGADRERRRRRIGARLVNRIVRQRPRDRATVRAAHAGGAVRIGCERRHGRRRARARGDRTGACGGRTRRSRAAVRHGIAGWGCCD